MLHHPRKILIIAGLCLMVFIFNKCFLQPKKLPDLRGTAYAGSEKCANCHKAIYDSYLKTAHSHTSQPATARSIKGNFEKDSNTLFYRDALKMVMEQTDSGFYQAAYVDNVLKQAARFDIVMGSGRKGQSYLYWFNENVFQLPVSYYVPEKTWVNSPGFPPQNVVFNRGIPIGCFECHSSYIKKTASKPMGDYLFDFFDKSKIIYSIDCERCHGAAAQHVSFHEQDPAQKKPMFIANIASLKRQQKLDMCAMCHSGARETVSPPFNYNPGDNMREYLQDDTAALTTNNIDVHGKQYQLLIASKCYLNNNSLTCNTCHNTHVDENNDLKVFSAKCISCHDHPNHDNVNTDIGIRTGFLNNCIDCHMPARPSALITMKAQTHLVPIPALVRTHFISIYPNATKQYLRYKK